MVGYFDRILFMALSVFEMFAFAFQLHSSFPRISTLLHVALDGHMEIYWYIHFTWCAVSYILLPVEILVTINVIWNFSTPSISLFLNLLLYYVSVNLIQLVWSSERLKHWFHLCFSWNFFPLNVHLHNWILFPVVWWWYTSVRNLKLVFFVSPSFWLDDVFFLFGLPKIYGSF